MGFLMLRFGGLWPLPRGGPGSVPAFARDGVREAVCRSCCPRAQPEAGSSPLCFQNAVCSLGLGTGPSRWSWRQAGLEVPEEAAEGSGRNLGPA